MADAKWISKQLEIFILDETNALQDEIFHEVKSGTPVDTGLAKASWRHTQRPTKVGQIGVIHNPQPYLIYLELGHSKQQPSGWIQRSITQTLNRRS